jgi:hypothetical protein
MADFSSVWSIKCILNLFSMCSFRRLCTELGKNRILYLVEITITVQEICKSVAGATFTVLSGVILTRLRCSEVTADAVAVALKI